MENVNRIVAEGIAAVEAAQDFNTLEQIKARYLGKTDRASENFGSNVA